MGSSAVVHGFLGGNLRLRGGCFPAPGGGGKAARDLKLVRCGMLGKPAPLGQKSQYEDSPFDLFCINHLATSMTKKTGFTTRLKGYEALIDISRQLATTRSPMQQRETVLSVLDITIPLWVPHMLRFVLRPSKFAWECYALTTPLLFQWLVGPAEIREAEVNGVMQKSVVHIKKCSFYLQELLLLAYNFTSFQGASILQVYLESSNCVGMCVNMCKIPSERFIKQEFGADVSMVPNFEDMSCDMIYGQKPIPLEQDPAMSQQCYKTLCMNAQGKERDCPKISPSSLMKIKNANVEKACR